MADDVEGSAGFVADEKLTFDIDELDDSEFDLPQVVTPPTLESILNEPDNDSVLDDDDISQLALIKGDSAETSSLSSQESLLVDKPRRREIHKQLSIRYDAHGSVLRPSKLKNISAQMLSAADRVDAGKPTALAVSAMVAVGTSHGLVLVFDPKQVLKWCLGSIAVGTQYGAVSALSFNKECSRLLCGFAKGQITMWDLSNGKLLRTISDAHPPGTAVLHVKFTDSPIIAVCSDSGGSVFELEFKRLIGVRTTESKCLFSGSRGEVCALEPLSMNVTIKDHPMKDVMVLAMGTLSKVLIVTLRPTLKVMFTHPLKGDASTLPLLAWHFVIIQVSSIDRVIDPVLAFARDQTIFFYQVICSSAQDIRCSGLQKMQVPYRLLSITWLNARTLVTIDSAETIHVIDVRSEEELEVIDISDVQLVYSSSYFKSLATGGNVSQALACAGENSCYQSVICYGGQLFLLGTKTVHVMTLRTWNEGNSAGDEDQQILGHKDDSEDQQTLGHKDDGEDQQTLGHKDDGEDQQTLGHKDDGEDQQTLRHKDDGEDQQSLGHKDDGEDQQSLGHKDDGEDQHSFGHKDDGEDQLTLGHKDDGEDQHSFGHKDDGEDQQTFGHKDDGEDQQTLGHKDDSEDQQSLGHKDDGEDQHSFGHKDDGEDQQTLGHKDDGEDQHSFGHKDDGEDQQTLGHKDDGEDQQTLGHKDDGEDQQTLGHKDDGEDQQTLGHKDDGEDQQTLGHKDDGEDQQTLGHRDNDDDQQILGNMNDGEDQQTFGHRDDGAVEQIGRHKDDVNDHQVGGHKDDGEDQQDVQMMDVDAEHIDGHNDESYLEFVSESEDEQFMNDCEFEEDRVSDPDYKNDEESDDEETDDDNMSEVIEIQKSICEIEKSICEIEKSLDTEDIASEVLPQKKMEKEGSLVENLEQSLNEDLMTNKQPQKRENKLEESECLFDKNWPKVFIKGFKKQNSKSKHDRVYDCVHACLFCHRLFTNIQSHLERKHAHKNRLKEIKELKQLRSEETDEVEKKYLEKKSRGKMTLLRNKGDNLHNLKVLNCKDGEILLPRRKKGGFHLDEYGPCPNCDEWIVLNSSITNHQKTCPSKDDSQYHKGTTIIQVAMMTGKVKQTGSKMLRKEVFPSMKRDAITQVAMEDPLILVLGDIWLMKNIDNKRRRRYYASFHMRLAARLLEAFRRASGKQDATINDILMPVNFDQIALNALQICSSETDREDTSQLEHPSTAIKSGFDIVRLASAKLGRAIKNGNETGRQEATDFLNLMKMEWSIRVNKVARSTLSERQFNKKIELPHPDDIVTFASYLIKQLQALDLSPASADGVNFRRTVMLVEARLLLYNRRRPGELEALSLEYYRNRSTSVSETDLSLRNQLSVLEKKMAETQELIEIRGKNGTRVPVICPEEVVGAMKYLANSHTRKNAGIKDGNIYLFANTALDVVRAGDSIDELRSRCGLKFPLRIHATNLRKYCATIAQRIDVLVRQGKYQEALALAQSFHDNKAKAVIGLAGSATKRRDTVSSLMFELVFEYVDLAMTQYCPEKGKLEELEDYYQSIVPVCVDYCLHLKRTDILFDRIYERFAMDVIARGTFLECLEPYILNDKLTEIPARVMKDFVEHHEGRGYLDTVEACIVHMHVSSLDIHQIVVLCWNHALYDAIIYVYNKGMKDYTTPLEELLAVLETAVNTGKQLTDDHIKLGNKLLVYISCCLAGRAYPLGDIPDDIIQDVKEKVFKCVTCLHTEKRTENEPAYPHLKILLQFDTREFLNVLALAFEEPEFTTEEGVKQRQRVVDILLQVMVESVGFSPNQVGILFTFLARQMARHQNTILVNRVLFEQVLEFLSNPDDEFRHEERQQALIELIHAGGLQTFNEARLLHLAENAKFFRVCELLYEKRREFDKILGCYLKDFSRKHATFAYINQILQKDGFTKEEKLSVQKEALKNMQALVDIDCHKAAQMVITGLAGNLDAVVKQLEGKPHVLFEFLQGVLTYKDSTGSAIYVDRQINVPPSVYEQYIDLMCQFKPHEVYNYIKGVEGYRLELTLEICRKHRVSEATAYLLERAGDIQGAFGLILEKLQSRLKNLTTTLFEDSEQTKDIKVMFHEVQAVLLVIIQLCQRNSGKMDEAGREALWFPLLETMMLPQRKLKDIAQKQNLEDFKELTHHVLNSMMGYIALPAILQKIMQDPSYNTGKFGEIKELILGMLETYSYEQTLMETCKSLLHHDLHVHLKSLTCAASRGFVPKGENCRLCNKLFTTSADTDSIIVFRCGHSYHTSCLRSVGSVHLIDRDETWVCHLCSSTKRGQTHSSRFQKMQSATTGPARQQSEITWKGNKTKEKESYMDPQHAQAFDTFRQAMKTPSRLAILTELIKPDSGAKTLYSRTTTSILQNEKFQLRLAPPPMDTA